MVLRTAKKIEKQMELPIKNNSRKNHACQQEQIATKEKM